MTHASIEDSSLDELAHVLAYLETRQGSERPPVLLGGWAVYALAGPDYLKSQDIDIVVNSNDRASLLHWLAQERHFTKATPHNDGWRGAHKHVPSLDQDILIDLATYAEEYSFYGRQERLDFAPVQDHWQVVDFLDVRTRIPTRSLLLLFKSKAAYDRAARLAADADRTPHWTRAKLAKDRSDIIALMASRNDWELRFLHDEMTRLPFLVDVWRHAPADTEAMRRGEHDKDEARERVERLLSAVGHA